MERTPIIAGNWKMHKTQVQAVELVQDINRLLAEDSSVTDAVEAIVCPPFLVLKQMETIITFDKSPLELGAQDVYWETEGAYTGEVSPAMISDIGCSHCIVGHSERREHFAETDETVNRKVRTLFAAGLTPIMCCGETLQTREEGGTEAFVRGQIREGLTGVDARDAAELVVAYEPIWAIGTGLTPTPEVANDVCRSIRATVGALFGPPAAQGVRILYGGSAKPENIGQFLSEPDIDGALVGGASLDAGSFYSMIKTARDCA